MKLAAISDIHGNSFALEQVLLEAKKEKAEKLLVLGDLVGYYYYPDKVIKMIKEWDYHLIKGNHEGLLVELIAGRILETDLRKKYGSGHRLALEKLTKEDLNQIITAPEQLKITVDNVNILMCHGSPWDPDFYLYPDASPELLEKCNRRDVDFVLIGHSHYQFIYPNTNSTLINVGSVGQSRKEGGVANWILIDTITKQAELKATRYDTSELEREIVNTDPSNPYLQTILKRSLRE